MDLFHLADNILESKTKRCSLCKELRLRDKFAFRNKKLGQLDSWCRPCRVRLNKERSRPNKDGKIRSRNHWARNYFGITADEYDKRIAAFSGICPICELHVKGKPNLDHDHKTGQIRDVLCRHCNSALGNLQDDIDRLERAIQYLRKWSS